MKVKSKCLVVALLAATASAAHAQDQISGKVNATLNLIAGCAVESGGGSSGNTDWGVLDFGTQPSGFTGSLDAQVAGSTGGITKVTCSPDIDAVQVTVDGGQHPGAGAGIGSGTRAMASGAYYVPYEVYSDFAHTKVYTAGVPQNVAIADQGSPFEIPMYGVANKTNTAALPEGAYMDILEVTLGW